MLYNVNLEYVTRDSVKDVPTPAMSFASPRRPKSRGEGLSATIKERLPKCAPMGCSEASKLPEILRPCAVILDGKTLEIAE